eukprot:jgi/Botrbrau1/14072/Bobra.182_3s0019.1
MAKSRFAGNRENVLPEQWPVVKDANAPRKRARKDFQEKHGMENGLPIRGMGLGGDDENFYAVKRPKAPPEPEAQSRGREPLKALDWNSEATDFSGLKNLLQGGLRPGNQPLRPRAPLENQTNQYAAQERRFQEPPEAQHVELLGSLLGADFATLSRDPFLNPAASGEPVVEVKRQQSGSKSATLVCEHPPIDWSLKKLIRVTSPTPLKCFEPLHSSLDVSRLTSASAQPANLHSAQETFQSALLSWRYPHCPLPPNVAGGMGGVDGGNAFLMARQNSWQESFRNLFLSLRSKACAAFYCIAPEGSKRPFVAFFGAAGLGSRRKIHAWMSHSSHGLRTVLQEEHDVQFVLPFAPPTGTSNMKADHNAELSDLGQEKAVKMPSTDGTSKSMLFFEGASSVMGFFDFLYNNMLEALTTSASDVPILLAPVPFLNATLHQLDMKRLPLGSTIGGGGEAKQLFRAEINGLVPPWGLDLLSKALRENGAPDCQVTMETHPWTAAFNFGLGVDYNADRSSLANHAEKGRLFATSADIAGAVLQSMAFDGVHFSANLVSVCKPVF